MAKKQPTIKELFPFTEQGFQDALEARGILWEEYKDAYHVLRDRLPELGIGSELYTLREQAELPIKKIKALEKHIDLIRRDLGVPAVKSILE